MLLVALNALLLALPLLALGRTEALRDPAVWLFALVASAFVLAERPASRRCEQLHDRTTARLATATGVLLLAAFWTALIARRPAPLVPWPLAGAVLMATGVTLRALAIRTLGRAFVSERRPADGGLRTSGVYRWLRHPSETGLLAIVAGAALLLGSAPAVLPLGALWLLVVVRVRREDRQLSEAFGDAHRRYASRVGGLLPRRPR